MKKKFPLKLHLLIAFACIAMFTLLFTSCTSEVKIPNEEEAKTAIMKKIQAANSGWASGNSMVFYENAAEDIVWIDDVGPSKRLVGKEALKTYLEGLNGKVPPHKHELFDFKFQFYGEIVIASYYYQGTMEGKKAPAWKAVSIFRYIDGDWFAVLEHWTIVTEGKKKESAE